MPAANHCSYYHLGWSGRKSPWDPSSIMRCTRPWCSAVHIFVIIDADRIPGVLARLRSQRVLGIWGETKSVHRYHVQLLYLTSKSYFSGVIATLKSQSVSRTKGWKRNKATGIKLKCCAFLKKVLLQVSTRMLCRATVGTNRSFLPGRIHEELPEMLHEICHPVQYIVFNSSWSRQWEVG